MTGTRRTILVVDDNLVNKRIMVSQIESLGYTAVAVDSGQEALEILGERHFDAVLMDCQMPRLDGYETTRRIRESEEHEHTIVIAVTAHGLLGERRRCLAAGMDDYLAKPFRAAQLGGVLRRWLGHQEEQEPVRTEVPPPEPSQSADLDSATIDRLQKLGVLDRVLDLFMDSFSTHMGALRGAVEGARFEEARQVAHTLRGASAQIGATLFAALCRAVENSAIKADGPACIDHLRDLERARPHLEKVVSRSASK